MRLQRMFTLDLHQALCLLLVLAVLSGAACAARKTYFESDGYLPTEAMPLSLYRVPVGTEKSFTIRIPDDYNAAKTPLAGLYLLVDDIDAPREASITVNEQGPFTPPKGGVGEAPGANGLGRAGFFTVKPGILKPGDNEVKFAFRDNQGGSTGASISCARCSSSSGPADRPPTSP